MTTTAPEPCVALSEQEESCTFSPKLYSSPVTSSTPHTNEQYDKDTTYSPSFDDSFVSTPREDSNVPLHAEKKYVVFESCLLQLLQECKTCHTPAKTTLSSEGTFLTASSVCSNGHQHTWTSQPMINGKAAGNLLLSAAILFSGSSPAKVLRLLRFIAVQVMCDRTYFNYQRGFLVPAIEKVWSIKQQQILAELRGQPVELVSDGRCDSPGFSAKYMTYSFLASSVNKVIYSVQIQVGECEQVRSSVSMEKHALVTGLADLRAEGIQIASLTTDRHSAIRKYMRLKKKMAAASKRRGLEKVGLWIQSATNHMYWSAAMSGDDIELRLSIWKSMHFFQPRYKIPFTSSNTIYIFCT
ncbi:uncharacterized protein LOC135372144 [Ornithodoros turicata]|uniref:uncharacterized protein LOC135372144 n=1 Tax=Ornithodoros turicata TaxID=34597 RepID=UPI00313A030E